MKPTYEELEARLYDTETKLHDTETKLHDTETRLYNTEAKLHDTETRLQHAEKVLKAALEEIVKLKERINRNSSNSSKPPSSDQKGNTPNKDKKRSRKSRTGKSRPPFPPDKIDKHVQCTQENCPHCGSSKICLNGQLPRILQQAELPEIKAFITEYLLCKYFCQDCKKNSTAPLPPGIPESAFGPKLMGLLATLTGVLHIAKREAIQLINDLYDVDMGVGSVPNIEERVATALNPIYARIYTFIVQGNLCTYFDETGWRDQGKHHFVWIASCEQAALYRIDRNRSKAAFQRLIGQETWKSPSVSDRYSAYNSLENHQFCFAHLIRNFKGYTEREGPDKVIGLSIVDGFRLSCKIHREYREGKISLMKRNRRLGARKRRVEYWLLEGLANGSDSLSKLCNSLLDNSDKLWMFTKTSGVEPTNNIAERDLRKLVIWRKKSYGTRSDRGKRFVERITTISQSIRKQGGNVLHFVQQAIESFYARTLPPLISEELGF